LITFVDAVCTPSEAPDRKAAQLRELASQAHTAGVTEPAIVNRKCFRDHAAGRTPLAYAVALNDTASVRELIAMDADVNATMERETALTIAIKSPKGEDSTEVVRLLLSKGADPAQMTTAGIDENGEAYREQLNETMRHWLAVARRVGMQPPHVKEALAACPPMHRMHELNFSVVGEEPALALIKRALSARFGNPAAQTKPLVMALLGPPGHGKTYLVRNLAQSLVGEDNVLEVACGNLRDDADLFGSSLGGSSRGDYSSDGRLTAWLRARQERNNIVFLDEFDKIQGLASALGWEQDKKMYQAFLEPWQEGTITDVGASARRGEAPPKVRVTNTVWILTSNWGQSEIVKFANDHKERVYGSISDLDVDWLKKELVHKTLKPLLLKEFKGVHSSLQALARRVDEVVPFLPFTAHEQLVVADLELRRRLADYRKPCVRSEDVSKRRMLGNVVIKHTRALAGHATTFYDPMQGATTMSTVAREADGLFINKFAENKLMTSEAQQRLLNSEQPPQDATVALPEMWLHYDDDLERVCLWEGERPPARAEEEVAPVTTANGGSGSGTLPEAPTPPAGALPSAAAPINPFA